MVSNAYGGEASGPTHRWRFAMNRKVFDCRQLPGECTLTIAGTEDEVLEAQAMHAAAAHDQRDGPELREFIRTSLKDEVAA
jgi:predicted small metal-binding protein